MRPVGEILKESRIAQGYTLEDIEKHTKIRKELLEALEESNFKKLPPSTFIQGFIKNYGRFLNLNAEKLLAIYRRDYEAKKHPPVVLESFKNPMGGRKAFLTPSTIVKGAVLVIILIFFSYLWVENRQFVGAPNLSVTSPQDQQAVDIPDVVVSGDTDPEVKVFVNNQEIGVDKNGHFSEDIKLSSSVNSISVVARSRFGQKSTITRTVFVKK